MLVVTLKIGEFVGIIIIKENISLTLAIFYTEVINSFGLRSFDGSL